MLNGSMSLIPLGTSFRVSGALCAVLAGLTGPAFAHAHLVRSEPTADAVLTAAPDALAVTFSEPVELAFSSIRVTGPFGADVAVGKPLTGGSGQELRVSLPKLTAGRYGVRWLAVAADTHRSTGQFSFQIVP